MHYYYSQKENAVYHFVISCNVNKKGITCSTSIDIRFKDNPYDKKTRLLEKDTLIPNVKRYPVSDDEINATSYFLNDTIRLLPSDCKQISKSEYDTYIKEW